MEPSSKISLSKCVCNFETICSNGSTLTYSIRSFVCLTYKIPILTQIQFIWWSCCTKYPIVGFIHVCIENEEKRLPQIPINCVSPFDVHERTLRTSMRSQQPHSHALTKQIFQLCDALIDIPWAMLSRTEHMAMCLRFKCILYIMNPHIL